MAGLALAKIQDGSARNLDGSALTFDILLARIRGSVTCERQKAMKLEMLKSKLFQGCVTHADVDYEGSFGIDTELMEAVGLYPYEKVLVANIANGSRLETYVIPEPFGRIYRYQFHAGRGMRGTSGSS